MKNFFAKRASYYGESYDLEEVVREKTVSFIENLIHSNILSILDLGCGNGKTIRKLLEITKDKVFIKGMDFSEEMLNEASKHLKNFKNVQLIHADIKSFLDEEIKNNKKYDIIIIINTLHNLSSKVQIFRILDESKKILKEKGYLIFDIRNSFNPFINLSYKKNLKKGFYFFTLSFIEVVRYLKNNNLKFKMEPIFYKNIQEAGKENKNFIFRILYRIYLFLTRLIIFSPYILFIVKK